MKSHNLVYVLSCIIAFTNCSKYELSPEAEKESIVEIELSKYRFFISGKLNGEAFIYGQQKDDAVLKFQLISSGSLEDAVCANSQDQGTDSKVSYGTTVYPNFDSEDSQPAISIYFDRFFRCAEPEDFKSLFMIDAYQFSANDKPTGAMKQIAIAYSPISTGETYYSTYEKNNSDNFFKITSSNPAISNFGSYQVLEGEFSVTLYGNESSIDPLEITEGKFKINVSK